MNTATKEQISNDLRNYVIGMAGGSANQASKMLKNVSGAYISMMLAGPDKWKPISDNAWLNVQNQVRRSGWVHGDSTVSNTISEIYADVKAYSEVKGIVSQTDTGKSHSAKRFVDNNPNAFWIVCDEAMSKMDFLREILNKMGKPSSGYTTRKMLNEIVEHLLKMDRPLLIFDEFDKVKNEVLLFLITFYNRTEDKAALIIQGTPFLKERIETGVEKGYKGYAEIFSRIGSKFIVIPGNKPAELRNIARINGVTDESEQIRIVNDAGQSIRRIKSATRVFVTKREIA